MSTPAPLPTLLPLSPLTDAPAWVQIVEIHWTPDTVEDDDYVADCEPVLVVTVQPWTR